MANLTSDDGALRELALFAGAGGGILGGHLLGWRTVCAVEQNKYAACVLAARQNDGILSPFPIWDDVRTFDGKPWRGVVDVISGGFPCQDISIAGKGAGIEGTRSGLWGEFARIIREVEPGEVYVENVPALVVRGLGVVLGDLAAMGFDAEWGVFSCTDVGGVHLRERVWIAATNTKKLQRDGGENNRENGHGKKSESGNGTSKDFSANDRGKRRERGEQKHTFRLTRFPWGEDVRGGEDLRGRSDLPKPLIRGVADGLAARVDRLTAIGNGQVPRVAATAFRALLNVRD